MLFSTWQFILIFLPIAWGLYFWLNHQRLILAGKVVLVLASLFFLCVLGCTLPSTHSDIDPVQFWHWHCSCAAIL
jgi:hypothetical protein